MAQKQAEKEDLGCKSPCQCSALECHTGRAAGAGSGCDTGEDGAGSPSPVPGGIHKGTPQDAGGVLHQPVGFQVG